MPAEARRAAMARLDAGVRADLDAIENGCGSSAGGAAHARTRVYDEYLKANRVADGTASYGRALTLILSAPFSDALGTYTVSR